jgi:nicotinamidase/pyrazinamidase
MRLIFWNVDTQIDFIEPSGKLYVPGAEDIKPILERITRLASEKLLIVVNTADFHHNDSVEISDNPDFMTTFPAHCLAGTKGAEFIEETKPENPIVIDWEKDYNLSVEIAGIEQRRNLVIRKDAFDVFKGNRYAEQILMMLDPEIVVVYGVTTNVCVNDAVVGLVSRGKKVIVVKEAIKALPNLPLPFNQWEKMGVELTALAELEKYLTQI